MSTDEQAGYTLPEVLIATSIIAGLMMPISLTLLNSGRVISRSESAFNQQTAYSILSASLEQIFRGIVYSSSETDLFTLKGDRQKIQLAEYGYFDNSPYNVLIFFDSNAIKVRGKSQSLQNDVSLGYTLIDSVDEFEITYLKQQYGLSQFTWEPSWNSVTPPALIKFRYKLSGYEADSIILIDVGERAPLACSFDPISRRCR